MVLFDMKELTDLTDEELDKFRQMVWCELRKRDSEKIEKDEIKLPDEAISLLYQDKHIEAIKAAKQKLNISLYLAKTLVDNYKKGM